MKHARIAGCLRLGKAVLIAASAAGLLLAGAARAPGQPVPPGYLPPPGQEYPRPPVGALPPIEYDPGRLELRPREAQESPPAEEAEEEPEVLEPYGRYWNHEAPPPPKGPAAPSKEKREAPPPFGGYWDREPPPPAPAEKPLGQGGWHRF